MSLQSTTDLTNLTPAERELQAAKQAADPLPWRGAKDIDEGDGWWGRVPENAPECLVVREDEGDVVPVCCTNDDGLATENEVANGRYIVAACNSVPALLATIDRLRNALRSLTNEATGMVGMVENELGRHLFSVSMRNRIDEARAALEEDRKQALNELARAEVRDDLVPAREESPDA